MLNPSKIFTASLLTALALGAGGYWYWDILQNTSPMPATHAAVSDRMDSTSPADQTPTAPQTLADDPASAMNSSASASDDQIDETQALEQLPDPDLSSEALIGFAHQLAGLMEQAMTSEKEALPAYTELEECVINSNGKEVLQARLICFANASRLSKEFPSALGSRFRVLSERNPKLVGLLQTTGLE